MEKSKAWKSVRRWLPGLLISVVALFVVFRMVQWQDLGSALTAIQPISLAIAAVFTVCWVIVRAFGLRALLQGKTTVKDAFYAINIGYLLNNLFPLRAGEIGRAIVLGKSTGLGAMHVLSAIVLERVFDMIFAAAAILCTLPLMLEMSSAQPLVILTLVLVVAGLAVLYFIARNEERVNAWVVRLGGRWKFIEKYIAPQVSNFLRGFSVLTNPRQFLISLMCVGGTWGIAFVLYYIVLLNIAPQAPFWWGVYADAILAMGIAVPSAPANLGTFEGALVGGLSLLGISSSAALAYAVVMHFMQFLVTGMLGFIGLSRAGQSLSSLFSQSSGDEKKSVQESASEVQEPSRRSN